MMPNTIPRIDDSKSTTFSILSNQSNLRSSTGLLTVTDNISKQSTVMHFKRQSDPGKTSAELHEITRAAEATRDVTGIAPIEPVHGFPEDMLVTRLVTRGESLFNFFWNSTNLTRRFRQQILDPGEAGFRVGQWLRAYHASSLEHTQDVSQQIESIVASAERKLHALAQVSENLMPLRTRDRLNTYLQHTKRELGGQEQDRCRIHGDMALSNIIVSRTGHLFLADFSDTCKGLPCEDLVRFWHEIWTITQTSKRRARLLVPCLHAALDGYGVKRDFVDSPLFTLLQCWNAICNCLSIHAVRRHIGARSYRQIGQLMRVNANFLATEQSITGTF